MVEKFGDYDFGLTAEQEAHAAKLHQESIVVDMLFQGPLGYRHYTDEMVAAMQAEFEKNRNYQEVFWTEPITTIREAAAGKRPAYKQVWDESGITAANRDIRVTDIYRMTEWAALATLEFDSHDWLIKALTAGDIRRAKAEGRHAMFFNHQAMNSVNPDLRWLDVAYDFGLRVFMLTYNSMTNVGAGCTERTDAGLSTFGVKVVEHLNRLGVVVDTSHCGRQTTLDACKVSKAPVVATHATAEQVYFHARGKSDEELRAIAATGGLIGVVTVPFFLGPGREVTIEAFLDHVDYIANLVGWQHVGIGTDWPMMSSKWTLEHIMNPMAGNIGFRKEDGIDSARNLIGFDDYRDMPNITRGLVGRGYTDEQIRGILGENFLRVFEQVCG